MYLYELDCAVSNKHTALEDRGSAAILPGKLSFIVCVSSDDVFSELDSLVGGVALCP